MVAVSSFWVFRFCLINVQHMLNEWDRFVNKFAPGLF